jgi:hypothetical protein
MLSPPSNKIFLASPVTSPFSYSSIHSQLSLFRRDILTTVSVIPSAGNTNGKKVLCVQDLRRCFSTAGPRPGTGPSSYRKKNLPGRGIGIRFPTGVRQIRHLFSTASRLTESHPASYPTGTGGSFPEANAAAPCDNALNSYKLTLFVASLSPSGTRHDGLLPHPLQFIIHQSSNHSTLLSLATDSVVKQTTKNGHPVPRLRMRGAIPVLLYTSSWCGVEGQLLSIGLQNAGQQGNLEMFPLILTVVPRNYSKPSLIWINWGREKAKSSGLSDNPD